jgi:hypothetical protein
MYTAEEYKCVMRWFLPCLEEDAGVRSDDYVGRYCQCGPDAEIILARILGCGLDFSFSL